jgi:hypothetical protein
VLGFWVWGFGDWAPPQNPQSPIPNPQFNKDKRWIKFK